MPLYRVIWLDNNADKVGEDRLYKETVEIAMGVIGLRMYRSPHKIPDDAYGFIIDWATVEGRKEEESRINESAYVRHLS